MRAGRAALLLAALGACAGSVLGACSSDARPVPGRDGAPGGAVRRPAPATQPPGTDPALAALYAQRLSWRDCGDGFSCSTVQVPLDYRHPAADTIELAAIRLPAPDPARRIGSLLLNPGGPGGSGVEYVRAARFVVASEVRARFDIVGFDPRGVAGSTPVRCQSDVETDRFLAADGSPDDAREEHEAVGLAQDLARRCAARAARLLPHVGTVDTARDMDLLRAVLGDERLTYLGKSYGTLLGATYAELFPTRVGRLVLDGAVDPAASAGEVNREQARGFELALRAFVDDCLARDACPLPGPRAAALAAVNALLDRVDRQPLRGDVTRQVTQSLAVLGITAGLYAQDSWPVLRQAFAEARSGHGSSLLLLADSYTDRSPDGRYRTNSNDAIYAVSCLDRDHRPDLPAVKAESARLTRESPRFGAYLAWGALPCTYWPVPPTRTPHPVTAAGTPPILVVGTERDPATPIGWARALADQLASGVLLVWDGDGHTAYQRGSACIDAAVDAYLLDGHVPPDGKRCG